MSLLRFPAVSDWRLFGGFVVVTILLILSELSLFSSTTAGFTSEAMAQSLFAYGRSPDSLEVSISVLFSLSLALAGLMLAYRRTVFSFAFLTTVFLHNGLSFYDSSIVTQPIPDVSIGAVSSGFLMFAIVSIAFFELSFFLKKQTSLKPKFEPPESKDVRPVRTEHRSRLAQLHLLRMILEILAASLVVGLIAVLASELPSLQATFPGPLLNVGTNVGGSLRLAAGLFGGFALIVIFLRFLLRPGLRMLFSRKVNTEPEVNKLEKIRKQVLVKYLASLFCLQNELRYFVRRTPILILIPKRRDVTLIMLPLLALVAAYTIIGVIFSLGIFAGQVESLRMGYQNSIIPFDSSLYDLEQNSSVSDNVFSVGAEVAGAAVNDFLVEVANAVDAFFGATVK